MTKPKISVEVSTEQHAALVEEAKNSKTSLSTTVRNRLFPEDADTPFVEEAAAAPPAPPTPAPAPQVAPKKVSARQKHPCFHLAVVFPHNFSAKDCQGTCKHQAQRGRPCFWAAGTARNCNLFEPARR